MQVIKTVAELRKIRSELFAAQQKVGVVPTMGNLHKGHISLVDISKENADKTIATIFVNPLQFGENEDLDNYPKTEAEDISKLEAAGCDYLFMPSVDELFPNGKLKTAISVEALDGILCGKSRPGHLTGVATIVTKLFNLTQPDVAVFGEKDYQQLMVVRKLVEDLSLEIDVIGAPIIRSKEGLALSSRNGYLTEDEMEVAPRLQYILQMVKKNILDGERNYREIEKQAMMIINESGFKADYFEIRVQKSLSLAEADDKNIVILLAAFLGKARLIDNITFEL